MDNAGLSQRFHELPPRLFCPLHQLELSPHTHLWMWDTVTQGCKNLSFSPSSAFSTTIPVTNLSFEIKVVYPCNDHPFWFHTKTPTSRFRTQSYYAVSVLYYPLWPWRSLETDFDKRSKKKRQAEICIRTQGAWSVCFSPRVARCYFLYWFW